MIGKALLRLGLFVKINHISYYFKEPRGGMKAGRIKDFVHKDSYWGFFRRAHLASSHPWSPLILAGGTGTSWILQLFCSRFGDHGWQGLGSGVDGSLFTSKSFLHHHFFQGPFATLKGRKVSVQGLRERFHDMALV